MSLVVDGIERPLTMRRGDVHVKDKNTLVGDFPIELGEERASGTLELRMDRRRTSSLRRSRSRTRPAARITPLPAVRACARARSVFVPGNGGSATPRTFRLARSSSTTRRIRSPSSRARGRSRSSRARPTRTSPAHVRASSSSRTETAMRRAPAPRPASRRASTSASSSARVEPGGVGSPLLAHQGTGRPRDGAGDRLVGRARIIGLDGRGIRPHRRGSERTVRPRGPVERGAVDRRARGGATRRCRCGLPRIAVGSQKLDVSAGGEPAVKIIDADTGQPSSRASS